MAKNSTKPIKAKQVKNGQKTARRQTAKAGHSSGHSSGRPSGRVSKRPSGRVSGPPDPRLLALQILTSVFAGGQMLDRALADCGLDQLASRDRAFVRLLTGAVLRHHGQLAAMLAGHLTRKPPLPGWLVLMIGAAQLYVLETPPHAAADTTVTLMRRAGQPRMAGLANAVMRRLAEAGKTGWQQRPATENLPERLQASWTSRFGATRTEALARLCQMPPPLDISVAADPQGWADRLGGPEIVRITHANSLRCAFDGDVSAMPGFAEGGWWVQDAAAALPARLLNALAGGLAGKDVLDLCAAPGGKTAQLAGLDARVTAVEKDHRRCQRLAANLDRLGLSATIINSDLLDWAPGQPVPAILLDAPCSASGTIRRRPDLLVRKDFADLSGLAGLQAKMLARAASWLAVDGLIVYATCSMEAEEGEQVISACLDRPDNQLELVPLTADLLGPFAAALADDNNSPGWLRVMPDCLEGGNDGFFIACLRHVRS